MPQQNAAPSSSSGPAPSLTMLANAIRVLAMDAVEAAKSGHPGMPMGMADVAAVLWGKFLKFNPSDPTWPDRDRFILSGGHGSMLLYAVNYLTGYKKMTIEELKNFRQLHAITAGHPEVMPSAGIEMTTGPLGQGIATSVGYALAERLLEARFGSELVNHTTYVMAGDGDLMEGISHEAASMAGHLKLGKLIVFYDDNQISIDGSTALSFTEDTSKRFDAYGWQTLKCDGHNMAEIEAAIIAAHKDARPTIISCRTVIGQGSPNKAGTHGVHGSPLGADEIIATREKLGWSHAPFVIPEDVLAEWRSFGTRSAHEYQAWTKRHQASPKRAEFDAAMKGDLTQAARDALKAFKAKAKQDKPKIATRVCSGNTLEALIPHMPEMIGGSADLTGSVNTLVKGYGSITPEFKGRYIHYGVREHGMAAAMNGMALHGGIIPYAGTFLQFADYSRPAIRLGALMKQQVIHVMTHDSIGLGEDGPTHQPVEHLSSLRAIPNLLTFRPCDSIETAECWELALANKAAPSVLALSRQNLPTLRSEAGDENLSSKGAYILCGDADKRQVTLLATGSEVSIAVEAYETLKAAGISAVVVSVPCMELFNQQSDETRAELLGKPPRIAIEAGIRMSWDRYLREQDRFIGMSSFGESAPAPLLYKHFGITAEAIVTTAKSLLK
ncbi:MAG: transketolase [Alphaproteobacteria bacterium]|nr:transketolase [Alphaproteobacteria bacterium]